MSAQVKSVKIIYHRDEGAWWADSPDMPGFSAVGDTSVGCGACMSAPPRTRVYADPDGHDRPGTWKDGMGLDLTVSSRARP